MTVPEDFDRQWVALLNRVEQCHTEKDLENWVIVPLLQLLGYELADFAQQVSFGRR